MSSKSEEKLRGMIIRAMMGVKYFDNIMKEVVPKCAIKYKGKWKCLLCNRLFPSDRSIFYHLAYVHADEVHYYAVKYKVRKLREIGLEVVESEDYI